MKNEQEKIEYFKRIGYFKQLKENLYLILAILCHRKRFTGLFDRNGSPLFEGDKYVIVSTFFDELTHEEKGFKIEERKKINIETVEYHIWGSNAGFSLPLSKLIIKII